MWGKISQDVSQGGAAGEPFDGNYKTALVVADGTGHEKQLLVGTSDNFRAAFIHLLLD
jgi:hypothetical protein